MQFTGGRTTVRGSAIDKNIHRQQGWWAEVREELGGWLFMAASAVGPALMVIALRDHQWIIGAIGAVITAVVIPMWVLRLREGARLRRERRPPGRDGSGPPKRRRH